MNMTNVIAGFCTTGIVSFNRNALLSVSGSETPSKFNPKSLCEGTKLKFIPVYSPVQSKSMPPSSSLLYDFTEEEVALFTKRYEEGYDLTHDKRYNYWVQLKNDEGAMKDCISSEPVIINDSALPKSAIVSKDVSKESGVDTTKKNNASVARKTAETFNSVIQSFIFSRASSCQNRYKTTKNISSVLTSSENMKILRKKKRKNKKKLRRKENVR